MREGEGTKRPDTSRLPIVKGGGETGVRAIPVKRSNSPFSPLPAAQLGSVYTSAVPSIGPLPSKDDLSVTEISGRVHAGNR
jgi:hypothetical protein